MTYSEFADVRLGLEARLRETYEEEAEEQRILDLEHDQLMARLRENSSKFQRLREEKEEVRKGLRQQIQKLESEYQSEQGKEADHG